MELIREYYVEGLSVLGMIRMIYENLGIYELVVLGWS